jgi:rhodanese-related sulfurtransferase
MIVEDRPTTLSQSRAGGATVLMDVCEERETEGNHSLGDVRGSSTLYRQDTEKQCTHAARQQVVLVPKVNVEG